jgi:hypothetical protein
MMRVYNYTVMGDLPIEFFPEYLEACSQLEKEQGNSFVNKAADAVKIFVKDVFTNSYGAENTILFVSAVVLFILLIVSKEYLLAVYLGIQSAAICTVWWMVVSESHFTGEARCSFISLRGTTSCGVTV